MKRRWANHLVLHACAELVRLIRPVPSIEKFRCLQSTDTSCECPLDAAVTISVELIIGARPSLLKLYDQGGVGSSVELQSTLPVCP
jgi:hypothetical protein